MRSCCGIMVVFLFAGFVGSVSIEKLRREMYRKPDDELVSLIESSQGDKIASVEEPTVSSLALQSKRGKSHATEKRIP